MENGLIWHLVMSLCVGAVLSSSEALVLCKHPWRIIGSRKCSQALCLSDHMEKCHNPKTQFILSSTKSHRICFMAFLYINNSSKVETKVLNGVSSNALIYVLSYSPCEQNANCVSVTPCKIALLLLLLEVLNETDLVASEKKENEHVLFIWGDGGEGEIGTDRMNQAPTPSQTSHLWCVAPPCASEESMWESHHRHPHHSIPTQPSN